MCRSTPSAERIGATESAAFGAAARSAAAEEFFSSLRERFVAADMIRVGPGVDDVANGLRRDALDRGQHGRRVGSRSRRPRRRRRPRPPARRCSRRRRRSRKTRGEPPGLPGRLTALLLPAAPRPSEVRGRLHVSGKVPHRRPPRRQPARGGTNLAIVIVIIRCRYRGG